MTSMSSALRKRPYALYYWPKIPGRGELVRLALEEANAPYVDVGRTHEGTKAIVRILRGEKGGLRPFAPPVLVDGEFVVAQTANILLYLAPRHHLVPEAERMRIHAHQLQLTIADLISEAHDSHHPIAASLVYEDQRQEAARRADAFVRERCAKFLDYFENVAASNAASGGLYLVGGDFTYVDLSMMHVLDGLEYAFPHNFQERWAKRIPHLITLRAHVSARPRVAAYRASERHLPFSEQGIFRRYPELDRLS